jgi:hypothetical protein
MTMRSVRRAVKRFLSVRYVLLWVVVVVLLYLNAATPFLFSVSTAARSVVGDIPRKCLLVRPPRWSRRPPRVDASDVEPPSLTLCA